MKTSNSKKQQHFMLDLCKSCKNFENDLSDETDDYVRLKFIFKNNLVFINLASGFMIMRKR